MLADNLKKLLASEVALYIKTSQFHWNIEGSDFPQYHEFLGDMYAEVYSSIDPTAELIRTLDEYAPGSFKRYGELSVIVDQVQIPKAELMMRELFQDQDIMLVLLEDCMNDAEEEDQDGIANFIADRKIAHGKHRWMLRATIQNMAK
jgi:starvation-inducible DNA-binding protein